MDVFTLLSEAEDIQVILCGGFYDPKERAFHGQLTLDTLKHIHVRKAFLCPSAISITAGIWDYSYTLIQIQQQVLASSDKIIFLADSDKFEKCAMLKLCDISEAHIYVTDSSMPSHVKQLYFERSIPVITGKNDLERSGVSK